MTSTAVVEIIDLTHSPPPDNETQTVPKPADYGTEKHTTRAARKRKNGETRSYPAKSPLEHVHAQSGESTETQPAVDPQESNGEPKGKKKRRSKKNKDKENMDSMPPSREDTQHDTLPTSDNEQLFFVDTEPAAVPVDLAFDSAHDAKVAPSSSQTSGSPDKIPLLLPAHVSVLDPGEDLPVRIIQPAESDSDSDSYIEYLDYDDRLAPDMVRYFEAAAEGQKRFVCKRCGVEGEHRTRECPILICLTCGARDEHSTRSCPISKTCFTCGMKGHINKNCPNRHSSRGRVNNFDDCDRCGSDRHNTNECPTIWRLYEYVTDREREAILQLRESKQPLALGQGGEGYIANDEWCYNCGCNGHFGDDCQELPRPHDASDAPSAFGLWNLLTGPFSDAAVQPPPARAPRDWENEETFGDGWGANAPINVGKRARNKDRARMERRALELEEQEQDDEGDWFANPRNMRNRGVRAPENGRDAGGGHHHGFRKKGAKIRLTRAWKSDDPPPPSSPSNRMQSLLERVGNDDDHSHRSHSRDRRHGHYRDRDRDRDRDKDRGRERGGWERGRDRHDDRDWDRGRERGQDYGGGLSIRGSARGSASRNDSKSRHTGSEVGELREGRRREDSRNGSSRDRDKDRDRESRTSRDRGQRGPQYRGGYTR